MEMREKTKKRNTELNKGKETEKYCWIGKWNKCESKKKTRKCEGEEKREEKIIVPRAMKTGQAKL